MRRFAIGLLAASLALGAAACSGDDDDDAVEAEDDGDTDDGDTDDGDTGDDAASSGANPDSDYCQKARAYQDEFGNADDVSEAAVDALEDLKDGAPDDVADALDTFIEYGEYLLEGGDDSDFTVLEEQFPTLMEDSLTFAQYLEDECGIDIMTTNEETVDAEG